MYSVTHSITLTHSPTHSLPPSLTPSLPHSLTHSLSLSISHPLTLLPSPSRTGVQYADERLPLPDALQQLRDALAAATPPPPPAAAAGLRRAGLSSPAAAQAEAALATPALATPQLTHERTCVVCWDAPREVHFLCPVLHVAQRPASYIPLPHLLTKSPPLTIPPRVRPLRPPILHPLRCASCRVTSTYYIPLLHPPRCASCRAATPSAAATAPPRRAAPRRPRRVSRRSAARAAVLSARYSI